MLRWGVVPLLVWHFTVDALYTALLLLRSGNTYYVVSGGIAAGILLLPLGVSLALYLRRGGFLSSAGLSNADAGFVPDPVTAAAPSAEPSLPVRPLSRAARGLAAGAAVLLAASFLVPVDSDGPLVDDATGRAAAVSLARRFLRVNGADPDAWSSVAYTGTGFSYDQSVREIRPQEHAMIPGFSDGAARYVIEKGGPRALRRLADQSLPLAYWVVRFYRPEQKDEWKVLIDARRSRVVAFVHPIAEDAPAGPAVSSEDARRRASAAAGKLGYPAAEYTVLEVGTEARPKRVDTTVVLEAKPPGIGEARPRLTAVFHGPRLAAFLPTIQVPESFMREQRRNTSAEVVLTGIRIVAAGSLLGVAVILFLRRVREPGFRWRALVRPVAVTAIVAAAALWNTWPALFRVYDTEKPMNLFRLGLIVSLTVSLLGLLLVASIGFVLLGAARPGWTRALRRQGTLSDALLRAALSAAIVLGLSRWLHVLSARIPAFYDPDPSLPGSLADALPPVDVVWGAARGAFAVAVLAATAALAWNSSFFKSTVGRALGFAALALALVPSDLHSPGQFAFEYATGLLAAGWVAVCAFGLLRDHAAAWALFGVLTFGGRGVIELLAQSAPADRAAGTWALVGLAAAAAALVVGRREKASAVVSST